MKINKSSLLYRYATVFPFMNGANDGYALLLGVFATTVFTPILTVLAAVMITAMSVFIAISVACIGAMVSIFLDAPHLGNLTQSFLLHLKVGGAACAIVISLAAIGVALAIFVRKLCRGIEIVS